MSSKKLKLNPDKNDFLLIGSKVQRENFSLCFPATLLAHEVTPSPSARNLGVVFDSALYFKSHICGIYRACYYHICDIRRIRRFLAPSVAKTIATSLIGSKLDYSNSVLFNVTEVEIKAAGCTELFAWVVTKFPRFCHITPLLKSFHWFLLSFVRWLIHSLIHSLWIPRALRYSIKISVIWSCISLQRHGILSDWQYDVIYTYQYFQDLRQILFLTTG